VRPDTPAVTRRLFVVGAGVLLGGCLGGSEGDDGDENGGTGGESAANPATGEVTQMGDLTLTSNAFDDGEQIPAEYGYEAENVNPPLQIDGVPAAAESLAIVVDDPDAVEPAGKVWDHWIVWNIPPDTETIPAGWDPSRAKQGTNDYGSVGYGGPNPPDSEHRYRFKLFALDTTLDLDSQTDAAALGEAMDGHVLAQTQLDGTYPA
jgi:Raf kinase inhibitor-like YbhB/YbcL family protein